KAVLTCQDLSQIEDAPKSLEIRLDDGVEKIIGREESCAIPLKCRKLSRQHARIFPGSGMWGIEDLHSTNGVFVNGQRIGTAWLKHDDEIRFGPIPFRFTLEKAEIEQTAPVAATSDDDEDSAEKTMMFGSLAASEAVLKAMRTPDDDEQKPKKREESVVERREKETIATAKRGKSMTKLMILLLAIAVISGGVWKYLDGRDRRMAANIVQNAHITGQKIIEAVQPRIGQTLLTWDYSRAIADAEHSFSALTQAMVDLGPTHEMVSEAATVAFLSFERQYAPLFAAEQYDKAQALAKSMAARLAWLRERAPDVPNPVLLKNLTSAENLVELAELVARFRIFAKAYPASSLGKANPPRETVDSLDDLRSRFSDLKRKTNKDLSVNYLIFKSMVAEVEDRDLPLITSWREVQANR
ncbi:MAG: FHA domain-containing protein, partial [Pseudomonadota bacterium]|nr:FHA domain-containing protein [Pseudomonadota bacterium]